MKIWLTGPPRVAPTRTSCTHERLAAMGITASNRCGYVVQNDNDGTETLASTAKRPRRGATIRRWHWILEKYRSHYAVCSESTQTKVILCPSPTKLRRSTPARASAGTTTRDCTRLCATLKRKSWHGKVTRTGRSRSWQAWASNLRGRPLSSQELVTWSTGTVV